MRKNIIKNWLIRSGPSTEDQNDEEHNWKY